MLLFVYDLIIGFNMSVIKENIKNISNTHFVMKYLGEINIISAMENII